MARFVIICWGSAAGGSFAFQYIFREMCPPPSCKCRFKFRNRISTEEEHEAEEELKSTRNEEQ